MIRTKKQIQANRTRRTKPNPRWSQGLEPNTPAETEARMKRIAEMDQERQRFLSARDVKGLEKLAAEYRSLGMHRTAAGVMNDATSVRAPLTRSRR